MATDGASTSATQTEPAPAPSVLGTPAPSATPAAPATGTPAAGAKDQTAAPTPAVAAGEIKLTVPKDAPLTEDHVKSVAEFAKSNGLTQAQAEKVLARDADSAKAKAAEAKTAQEQAKVQQFQQMEKVKADGAKLFQQDADFGGAKYEQSVQDAKATIAKYADPELQKFLGTHPLGSDPLVLRMLARIGANLREDPARGGTAGTDQSKPTDLPSRWYSGTPSSKTA